jgi:hypothetical protein
MQRLTLILSDLYLPEEASRADAVAAPFPLPGLTALLRVASATPVRPHWRAWLAAELGLQDLSESSVAPVAAAAMVPAHEAASAWLATPVHLEARLDHVRLVDRGLLTLAEGERLALCAQFARQFGPQYQLHAGHGRDLLLTGLSANVATLDPARLLDTDVAPALPRGSDARELRKLGAEIEMWLHGSPINEARDRAGAPRISTLWLWGGGAVRGHTPGSFRSGTSVSMQGSDGFLAGLAHGMNQPPLAPAASGLAALDAQAEHQVVELAPMSGTAHQSLDRFDEHWCVPARAALERGALSSLDVVANDTCFRITAAMRWRFWRPHRTWFENVARRAQSRKA